VNRALQLSVRLALTLLVVGVGGLAALWGWGTRELARPRSFGPEGSARAFEVASGETSRAIVERLEREGLIASALLARLHLSRRLGDPPLRAGEYRFVSPASTVAILEQLRRGDVVTHPVTLVEGLTLFETADALAAAGFGPAAELAVEFSDSARVADLDPEATNLEGYLFPETYRFPRGAPARAIADTLVGEFRRRWEREVKPLLPGDEARTVRELVILASLVEKEAGAPEERPLVAAVYSNRLRRGIGLYADPTIIYGLKLAGRWDGNLRRRDLEEDSPWNTYRRGGLPPGPICSPGAASLRAAARPAKVDYLYFVSRNDGTHVFAHTLAEHNRNVERWQRQYFRERRRAAADAAAAGDGETPTHD
jgi:UPF0755 protein